MRFSEIKRLTVWGIDYSVTWNNLESFFRNWSKDYTLDLDPDFQRGHVWSEVQQQKYVEFKLRRGKTGSDILFNCPRFNNKSENSIIVLVDGKQRLTAVRKFLNNELKVFGHYYSEYEDTMNDIYARFTFFINSLETRKEILNWYLEVNSGTPHTEDELQKVLNMIKEINNV